MSLPDAEHVTEVDPKFPARTRCRIVVAACGHQVATCQCRPPRDPETIRARFLCPTCKNRTFVPDPLPAVSTLDQIARMRFDLSPGTDSVAVRGIAHDPTDW